MLAGFLSSRNRNGVIALAITPTLGSIAHRNQVNQKGKSPTFLYDSSTDRTVERMTITQFYVGLLKTLEHIPNHSPKGDTIMATARKTTEYLANPLQLSFDSQGSGITLTMTQEEADYLAELTAEYRTDIEDLDCICEACRQACRRDHPEPTQGNIHRQRIFTALLGVTKPS
mgnify:CR=1 FL=1